MEHDEPLTAFAVHRPAGEVHLPARRGVVAATEGFTRALPEEVHREAGIDRHEVALAAEEPRVVYVSGAPQLDGCVLVDEVVEALGAEGEGAHHLGAVVELAHPVHNPRLDQVDQAVTDQLGVYTEITVVAEGAHDRVGDGTDAGLDTGSVGDAFGDEGGDGVVVLVHLRWRHLHQRPLALDEAFDLADVDLVATERARHMRVDFEEEPCPADEAARVVGAHTEAEVTVPVRRRGASDHQGIVGPALHMAEDFAEVVGNKVNCALQVARSGDGRQEVRDVPQAVAVSSVKVGAVVEGMHLVHDDTLQGFSCCGRLDGVEQGLGLAVSQGHDEMAVGSYVIENGFGGGGYEW